jgi:hypothetical protein
MRNKFEKFYYLIYFSIPIYLKTLPLPHSLVLRFIHFLPGHHHLNCCHILSSHHHPTLKLSLLSVHFCYASSWWWYNMLSPIPLLCKMLTAVSVFFSLNIEHCGLGVSPGSCCDILCGHFTSWSYSPSLCSPLL